MVTIKEILDIEVKQIFQNQKDFPEMYKLKKDANVSGDEQ